MQENSGLGQRLAQRLALSQSVVIGGLVHSQRLTAQGCAVALGALSPSALH